MIRANQSDLLDDEGSIRVVCDFGSLRGAEATGALEIAGIATGEEAGASRANEAAGIGAVALLHAQLLAARSRRQPPLTQTGAFIKQN